jgi:hypothetical protein
MSSKKLNSSVTSLTLWIMMIIIIIIIILYIYKTFSISETKYILILQCTLKMGAKCSSDTFVTTYQSARCHDPGHNIIIIIIIIIMWHFYSELFFDSPVWMLVEGNVFCFWFAWYIFAGILFVMWWTESSGIISLRLEQRVVVLSCRCCFVAPGPWQLETQRDEKVSAIVNGY